MMTRTWIFGSAAAVILLAGPATAGASSGARYRFATVIESTCDPGVPPFECDPDTLSPFGFSCPAINTLGVVAVLAETNGNFEVSSVQKLLTVRRGVTTLIADTAQRANSPTPCDNGFSGITSNPSINELGEVSFQGNIRRLSGCPTTPGQQRQGIFLGSADRLTTISHTINGPEANFSEFLVADSPCNTLGQVAIVPEIQGTFDQGLFTGSRTGAIRKRYLVSDPETDFNGTSSRPSINELSQIAFQDTRGSFPTSVQGIFLSNPNSTFSTVVDNASGEFDAFFDPSLNLFGRVAFQAFKTVAGEQVIGIFTSRGGPVTTVADNSGRFGPAKSFSSFGEPSLNDIGLVAFTADTNTFCSPEDFLPEQGAFIGGDPDEDKVLSTCDTYEGKPITGISMCNEGLNNLGEIVMLVSSQVFDPETFTFPTKTWIVKATPVPGRRG